MCGQCASSQAERELVGANAADVAVADVGVVAFKVAFTRPVMVKPEFFGTHSVCKPMRKTGAP